MISTNKASIGRYEILEEIGRGAMGVVYKARDPQIDRVVAIKTISLFDLEADDEQEYRERFQQEARTAGRLSHPGIVAVFDVGSDPETKTPYIVMEYVAGHSLTRLVADDHGKLPLLPALQLVEEVAEALHYAHGEGVIHRDIKPANILLTPEGRAKLADFGIARMDQSHLTLPGRLMGSPAYMAPEQMKGEATDGRSDLFALGVVLYRLSTGYRPFQGNSTATVCYKLLRQDPLPPSALNSELPPALDDLLNKAMAKDPAQRFQTGEEMALAIRALRQSVATQQDPLAPMRRLIDRTGVSHVPVAPSAVPIIEGPLQPVEIPTAVKLLSSPGSVKKAPDRWMMPVFISALAASVLAMGFLWVRHHTESLRTDQQQSAKTAQAVMPQHPEMIRPELPAENATSASLVKGLNEQDQVKQSAAPKTTVNKRPQSPRHEAPPSKKPRITSGSDLGGAQSVPDQPIVVHNVNLAELDVVIEHGFEAATASVSVDQKPLYSQELHGESKRKALLFRRTQGKQSGTINLLPGKHDIVVRIQSPDDGYDASKALSEGFAQGSKRILLIKCDKRKNKMNVVIQ